MGIVQLKSSTTADPSKDIALLFSAHPKDSFVGVSTGKDPVVALTVDPLSDINPWNEEDPELIMRLLVFPSVSTARRVEFTSALT